LTHEGTGLEVETIERNQGRVHAKAILVGLIRGKRVAIEV